MHCQLFKHSKLLLGKNVPILAVGEVQTLRDAGEMRARQADRITVDT